LLGKNIKTVCEDGGNSQARSEMLLGSCYAGVAFANSPVAAVHALAYPLGTHFKVPHGLSNSLMLSHVIRFNADGSNSAAHEYSEAAKIIFGQSALGWPSDLHGAHYLADSFELLSEELNLPLKLSEVGVTENDIEALTSAAAKQERLLPNNPVPVSIDDIRELYLKAL
jgi:alcohol dehydrogenase class IV